MSNKESEGREVKELYWETARPRCFPSRDGTRAFFIHGPYDVDWIVERAAQGYELQRHNVRYVATIVWMS